MSKFSTIAIDQEGIKKYLPHRSPLLLIDAVHELILGEKITASKQLTVNEPVFAGHFPGNPIYPGVYFVESIAQAGAILGMKTRESMGINEEKLGVLTSIEEARFRRSGLPGDRIFYEVHFEKTRGNFIWLKGFAFIDDDIAAECKLSLALGKQKGKKTK